MYALFNLAAALISYPAGSFSDKLGRKNVLLASLIIFVLTYIGFARAQNVLTLAALFVVYGLYQGNISGSRKSIRIRSCSRKSTSKRRWMVQQHGRVVTTGGEHRSRITSGSSTRRR